MDQAILVGPDIEFGKEVLHALDSANFQAPVALWLLAEDIGGWRLMVGSPIYDKAGPREAYLRLHDALAENHLDATSPRSITIKGAKYPLIRGLRSLFGKTKNVEGMRLGGQSIGGVWIDDAYVYRIR